MSIKKYSWFNFSLRLFSLSTFSSTDTSTIIILAFLQLADLGEPPAGGEPHPQPGETAGRLKI